MTHTIRLGSRGSPLALAQTQLVQKLLGGGEHPIETFTTTGDRIQDRRLLDAGGKGLFTKELDEALLERRIDAAVHSMKDLPTKLPPGIILCCVPTREDPRDAFISHKAKNLMDLPQGAIIGTASLRRQAQALNLRPDLKIVTLRGSVQTRLKKLEEGSVDATFLALAGLKRLGLESHATSIIAETDMPTAAGQGALAVTCREEDRETRAAFAKISLREFDIATTCERAFLDALDGSCRTPIGALATIHGTSLHFIGEVLTPDGAKRWRRVEEISLGEHPLDTARDFGRRLGQDIRAEAGSDFTPDKGAAW
ncbi:MAG TPA: hydroxymethylbilane synthase [Rhizomicrobium sp.]|nr:hydroxymethylbilane synthase [Rhizomicrobium sp.]